MDGDIEKIRKISQGDKVEFESLFKSSYAPLVRYAKILIKDHDSSEEIVQDLFFKLWQERKKIKIESSLNGYLFRAVHNRCLHWIGHKKVIERHVHEMGIRQPESPEIPTDILNHKELQSRVADILQRLPERCGRIFCMNRFEGLKYAEIAKKLSVSVKTVEANMGRALKEFRKSLAEQ